MYYSENGSRKPDKWVFEDWIFANLGKTLDCKTGINGGGLVVKTVKRKEFKYTFGATFNRDNSFKAGAVVKANLETEILLAESENFEEFIKQIGEIRI